MEKYRKTWPATRTPKSEYLKIRNASRNLPVESNHFVAVLKVSPRGWAGLPRGC